MCIFVLCPHMERIGATISSDAMRMPSSAMSPVSSRAHVGSPLALPCPKTCANTWTHRDRKQQSAVSITYLHFRKNIFHMTCKCFLLWHLWFGIPEKEVNIIQELHLLKVFSTSSVMFKVSKHSSSTIHYEPQLKDKHAVILYCVLMLRL